MYSSALLGMGVVNLIAHRIFNDLDGARGIEGWRWWLNAREGRLAAGRIRQERLKESKDTESLWNAVRQTASDKRIWLFCLIAHAANVPQTFIYFFPTIISAMGYGDTRALLLACPPFICAALACIAIAWSSGYFHERTWHLTACLALAVIGFVVAAATMNPVGRYVACYIFPVAVFMITPLVVSWTAATLSQSPEKKAIALGMLNVSVTLGYIYGPYLWPSSDGPRYAIGLCASAAFSVAAMALCWLMHVLLRRENMRMKRSAGADTVVNLYGY
ncbi:hypothetical protein PG989_003780 [Apiospora arundinis]|uniref:MFS general substrate transporter n=1 Tax=Apiospora arundinis TaxID=335852 RepID=A0ABR2I336_9PEZI